MWEYVTKKRSDEITTFSMYRDQKFRITEIRKILFVFIKLGTLKYFNLLTYYHYLIFNKIPFL